ncbi:hypothetical protein BCR43DRAFT_494814 [Syncephalastrum racemosum]|uniref:VHS domain-containing protein n=1 Tax=Syncephalastrum racemosum TaxID=13706 RepID=A0A1X2H8P0_SYNRA|nr:hypothetical protein BCR43DRAFT_494814 [Syncephalastrum racemosum]
MPLFSKKITPTTITANIEKATDASQTETDWSLVFQICDGVNSTELGAKEARKLLQKKMLSDKPQTQLLALELLDALSENCRDRFRDQLGAKSFAEDLDTLAFSRSNDDRVHSKLVHCLQNWCTRFGSDPALAGVQRVFEKVTTGNPSGGRRNLFRPSGFPTSNQRLVVSQSRPEEQRERQPGSQGQAIGPTDPMNDVLLAKNNAQLFSQTLSFTDPTQEDISKNELIQEFYGKCKMFQTILGNHLQTCEDEDVISSLLEANGELITCFKAYDDMLERSAVNEATQNSQVLHSRGTRQEEMARETSTGGGGGGSSSSSTNNNSPSVSLPQPSARAGGASAAAGGAQQPTQATYAPVDPFDPFSDSNEVQASSSGDAGNSNNNGVHNLPPPLTPQRMHD